MTISMDLHIKYYPFILQMQQTVMVTLLILRAFSQVLTTLHHIRGSVDALL